MQESVCSVCKSLVALGARGAGCSRCKSLVAPGARVWLLQVQQSGCFGVQESLVVLGARVWLFWVQKSLGAPGAIEFGCSRCKRVWLI